MPYVIATDRPVLWAVVAGGAVLAADQMEPGGLTVTGNDKTLTSADDENTFLGLMAGKAGAYKPLPASGWLEAGEIYGYGGGLVLVRQSHNRTEHAPADVPALFAVYRENADEALEWVAGEQVLVGTRRLHNGVLYECIQAHQTAENWTPDATPALWKGVVTEPAPGAWAAGVAYAVGQRVTYNGATYECRQAHTSLLGWEPPNVPALWLAV